jgi:hypothetical protein
MTRASPSNTAALLGLASPTSAYVSICQHTSAYVSIRQHTHPRATQLHCWALLRRLLWAYSICILAGSLVLFPDVSIHQHAPAYVSIRQHTPACASIRQHTSAYTSMHQHAPAYVSIRQRITCSFWLGRWRRCPTSRSPASGLAGLAGEP